jgi:hypothetical protein
VTLLDDAGRPVLQHDGEPAGGHRPTSGWTAEEVVEDIWRLRLPRDVPRGRLHVAVGLVSVASGKPALTDRGDERVMLPVEVPVE